MICDRVAIILGGRIVNQGALHELISEKIEFVELTVSGIPIPDLETYGACLMTQGGRILLKITEENQVPPVLRLLQERGATLHSLVPRTQSLEDLFVGTVRSG